MLNERSCEQGIGRNATSAWHVKGSAVKIRLFNHHCRPQRAYPTDSGMDLRARIDDSIWLQPLL